PWYRPSEPSVPITRSPSPERAAGQVPEGLVTSGGGGGEQQGRDAGRGGEREPGHPTELQPERHPSARPDSRRARRRSTAEKLGPAHQLRPGRNRKPVVRTPPHQAEHRARLDVGRGQERRTRGDV